MNKHYPQIKEHFKPLNTIKKTISQINQNFNKEDENIIKDLLKNLVEDFKYK